jgi:anti-sigma regulatory factor (Ser/Thr protein kinase)
MSDVVELSFPVGSDLVVLARFTAATVASRGGFDVEQIEDLRLAVDELCVSLIRGTSGGRMTLTFDGDDDRIEVTCVLVPDGDDRGITVDSDAALAHLSTQILDSLVDEHGSGEQDGQSRAWLRKRRTLQQA